MKDLQEYLKALITVETDIATQNQIIDQYRTFSLSKEPVLLPVNDPPKPEYSDYVKTHDVEGADKLTFIIGFIAILFIIFFFWSSVVPGITFLRILFLIIGIGGIWFTIKSMQEKKQIEKAISNEYNIFLKATEAYNTRCEENKRINQKIASQYHEDHSEWETNQRSNIQELNHQLIKTQTILNELYKKDLIYKKYQNLPSLTSIYEYLLTGRCDSLTGPHGAYNLYEDEVRKDTVISQLNEVINNLEKIRANQYMLYQQIKTIQENTAEIGLELSRIRSNTTNIMELTAINAYYSALTARNTEVTAAYHLLS